MKPEAQIIAIAKACGWTGIRECTCSKKYHRGFPPDGLDQHLPDYLNDLNAMYEAEIWLKPSQWPTYHSHLVECWNDDPKPVYAYETHATAAQRAEAFLKTLNLWTEG